MKYRLCVDGFGKIKHAEVESAPLTFFVGDNNSGKSYLLALFWALHSVKTNPSRLFNGISGLRIESANRFRRILSECVGQLQNDPNGTLVLEVRDLVNIINKLLENNKEKFISSIFNSQEVNVDRIWIESEEEEVVFKCRLHEMGMPEEVMEKCQLESTDVLDKEKVAIYQFTDKGDYSTVERIQYIEGMFQIPTFQNALLGILEQTNQIQDFES